LARVIVVWDILTLVLIICIWSMWPFVNMIYHYKHWRQYPMNVTTETTTIYCDQKYMETQVAAIHFRIFCLSLDCPFWLSLLFYLTSIYKRFRWCTWTVALSYHVTRYGLCSGLPYYYMTILPGEGSPYLPPGNVWEALWLESCDPSPVQSKYSKIILS
jgi:hypothetical protein